MRNSVMTSQFYREILCDKITTLQQILEIISLSLFVPEDRILDSFLLSIWMFAGNMKLCLNALKFAVSFVEKGPAADATDAPQP